MKQQINNAVKNKARSYARQFAAATPFKHVVIDDFLDPTIAQALLDEFPSAKDPSKLVNEFGTPHPKSAISDVKSLGPTYRSFDEFISQREFLSLIEQITGIPELMYDPYYYGGGTHENFHSAGLDPHFDFNIHPKSGAHRRINLIIYLNKDWDPSWKGSICFHSNPWDMDADEIHEVQTAFNRCVIFETTENSWHSVPPVDLPAHKRHLSRKSFTIYLYTKTRPVAETAVSHGTVYVQRNLPSHIKPGHTLTQTDVDEIKSNIARRNEYLKNLYKREYSYEQHIAELKSYIHSVEKAMHLPLQGSAKLLEVSIPPYPDLENLFMNRMVEFKLKLLKPAMKARLAFWAPETIDKDSAVSFAIQNESGNARVAPGELKEIELHFEQPLVGEIVARIACDRSRQASMTDTREVSIILHEIYVGE